MKQIKLQGKIKIVRVIARLDIGGAPLHVIELETGLNRNRFESVLVSGLENPGERSLLDYVEQLTVTSGAAIQFDQIAVAPVNGKRSGTTRAVSA